MLQNAVSKAQRGSFVRVEIVIEDVNLELNCESVSHCSMIDPMDFNSTLKCFVTHEAEDAEADETLEIAQQSARDTKD